jgi:hypothetical protein
MVGPTTGGGYGSEPNPWVYDPQLNECSPCTEIKASTAKRASYGTKLIHPST